MTSPTAVRAAIALSVAATTGAIYYTVSEGGDSEKFNQWIQDKREVLSNTLQVENATLLSNLPSTQNSIDNQNSAEESPDASSEVAQPIPIQPSPTAKIGQRAPGAYCHTCSGPRIWFFAEKLRLKRRFTPHPDPPRE